MTKASENEYPQVTFAEQGSSPSTPASGLGLLYLKSDGNWYAKNDAGSEYQITGGASGIAATIFDAKGDIIAASAADTAARLAVGSNKQKLVAESGQSTGLKWEGSAWTSYTPTLTATTTNPTLGSSVLEGYYKEIDDELYLVKICYVVTTGGAFNPGSGTYSFALPFAAAAAPAFQFGVAYVGDAGTTHFAGVARVAASASAIATLVAADSTGAKTVTHNAPITWATGDIIGVDMLVKR